MTTLCINFLNSKYKLLTDLRSPPSFNRVEALGVPKVPRSQ